MQSEGSEWRRGSGGGYRSSHSCSDGIPRSLLDLLATGEPCQYFHKEQQSAQMQEEHNRRVRLLHEQKRDADLVRIQRNGLIPHKLPMMELHPNRVTLCLELSNAEQILFGSSHDGIAALLRESKALIRLPDRDPTFPGLINQVTITGEFEEVELVRQRIRGLTRITITVPVLKSIMNLSMIGDWLSKSVEDGSLEFPHICFGLQPNQPSINVSGPASAEDVLLRAVSALISKLFKTDDVSAVEVGTEFEVSAAHLSNVIGKADGKLVLLIARETNAHIHFPRPLNEPLSAVHSLIASGSPVAVLTARRFILGLLPLQVCVDVDNSRLQHSTSHVRSLRTWSSDYNVTVRIEKSLLEPRTLLPAESMRHFVCLCAHEHCLAELYKIAGHLLGRSPPPHPQSPLTSHIRFQLPALIGPIYAETRIFPRMEDAGGGVEEGRMNGGGRGSSPWPEQTGGRISSPWQSDQGQGRTSSPWQSEQGGVSASLQQQSASAAAMAVVAFQQQQAMAAAMLSSGGAGPERTATVQLLPLARPSPSPSHLDSSPIPSNSGDFRGRGFHSHYGGSRYNRDNQKHTLELRPRSAKGPFRRYDNERNNEQRRHEMDRCESSFQSRDRRFMFNGQRSNGGSLDSSSTPAKSSYADVLQQKGGRMDPLQLIALAGRQELLTAERTPEGETSDMAEKEVKGEDEKTKEVEEEEGTAGDDSANTTTYAQVVRSARLPPSSPLLPTLFLDDSREDSEHKQHSQTFPSDGFASPLAL